MLDFIKLLEAVGYFFDHEWYDNDKMKEEIKELSKKPSNQYAKKYLRSLEMQIPPGLST